MSVTYDNIPTSVRDIFADIVDEVSTNISTEDSLSIDSVTFYCETWLELINRINKEGQAQMVVYPFIALIRNWDLEYNSNTRHGKGRFTFVICTNSTSDKYSEDRETDNYIPILRPICAELLSVIRNSGYFLGYNNAREYTYTESLHLGTDSPEGNRKYMIPDVVDAIILSDMDITLNQFGCNGTVVGEPLHQVSYLNNITGVTLTGYNSNQLYVYLTSAEYTDVDEIGFGAGQPDFGVYTSHDEATNVITLGGHVQFDLDGLADGLYSGYVFCDDGTHKSRITFQYSYYNNNLNFYTNIISYELKNFTLLGTYYENYPFDVELTIRASAERIEAYEISIDGGNQVVTEQLFAPRVIDTGVKRHSIMEEAPTAVRDVVMTYRVDGNVYDCEAFYLIT